MHISGVTTRNYRSLENFHIDFLPTYTLISGKNNSGKSSIFRAIRSIIGNTNDDYFAFRAAADEMDWATDITFWKKQKSEDIRIDINLVCDSNDDSALSQFISRMSKRDLSGEFGFCVTVKLKSDGRMSKSIKLGDDPSDLDEYATQEIIRWIREKEFVTFHDSTRYASARFFYRQRSDFFSPSSTDVERLEELNSKYSSVMKKILKSKKEIIEETLGRLGDKYTVELNYPKVNFESMPFDITLSEQKGGDARLDDWGSGTRNRTLILSSILRARQSSRDINHDSRFRPLVLIEEPESFLHPSAQADFGRAIEDMANDFGIQIIVSSHSPFMLSRNAPKANVLLERATRRNLPYETTVCDTTGDSWMSPFANALGVTSNELEPWAEVLQGGGAKVLIVEGILDEKYIKKFCEKNHGILDENISIRPIGGKDKLSDSSMINFIHKFVDKVVFLLDLDAIKIEEKFRGLGLVKNKDYVFVGKDMPGLRRIEGLLPEEIRSSAYAKYPNLVSQMQSDQSDEKKSALSKMKEKIYEEFCAALDDGADAPDLKKALQIISKCFDINNKIRK